MSSYLRTAPGAGRVGVGNIPTLCRSRAIRSLVDVLTTVGHGDAVPRCASKSTHSGAFGSPQVCKKAGTGSRNALPAVASLPGAASLGASTGAAPACQAPPSRTGARGAGGGGAGAGGRKRRSKGPVLLSEGRFDDVGLSTRAERHGDTIKVRLRLDTARPMTLHWGLDDWAAPPASVWPPGSVAAGEQAAQTPFGPDGALELAFPGDATPYRMVFVLKQHEGDGGGEVWFNNGGANYGVQLRAPPMQSFTDKVLAAEGTYSHWSLHQRLCLATEVLDAAEAAGPGGMSFLFAWLRLSSTRVLDWYRNANFQPKDVAAMQKHAGERIADKVRSSAHPLVRLLARGALAGLPRGGGNGDDIRMGILHIMRSHGIREGHRPGHDEPFLEQWHQKLHTNTSPDDVAICEAYLAFLHSGNHDDYWRVLWEQGRLTREKLESWPQAIKAWPQHLPHLIPAFQHYLWTLKTTHSGADLDTAMEMAKGHMDGELRWVIYDILAHRNDWWVPGKIVEARQRLAAYWKAPGSSRDLLLLDIALEGWFRTCLERLDLGSLRGDDLIELVGLVLRGTAITYDSEDLGQCGALWDRLRGGGLPGARWGREWGLAALAAAERLQLSVAAHMDELYGLVQPHAEAFGSACRLDRAHIANFGEEVVRGQPLFLASGLLQRLSPMLREAAGGAPWQIVSQSAPGGGAPAGEVVAVVSLGEVQGASFAAPTLLLADKLTGVEDIPPGVVGVLTQSSTDVLSHLAIRARTQRVLLATCFDEAAWAEWRARAERGAGARVAALVDPALGTVTPVDAPAPASGPAASSSQADSSAGTGPRIQLQAPEFTDAWALAEPSFRSGLVGAKALNLTALRRQLAAAAAADGGAAAADGVAVPASVALPYGTFERVLAEPRNAAAAAEVERLTAAAMAAATAAGSAGTLPREELEQLRRVVAEDLVPPPELVRQLAAVAAEQGLISSPDEWVAAAAAAEAAAASAAAGADDEADADVVADDADTTSPSASDSSATDTDADADASDADVGSFAAAAATDGASWPAVWRAVCAVWASKWTDRAWLSRRAVGVAEEQLCMSVLVQQVMPFRYAFVLHTSNPVTHTPGELLGEVVVGMGETLVGNYPGRALGFTAASGSEEAQLLSLPSKRLALHAASGSTPGLIARSDANAEDLEEYAAAGLYDSVPLAPLAARPVDYAAEPLLCDPSARSTLLARLARLGRGVAAAFGGRDQDVEGGVLPDGRVAVVQARPQVRLHAST